MPKDSMIDTIVESGTATGRPHALVYVTAMSSRRAKPRRRERLPELIGVGVGAKNGPEEGCDEACCAKTGRFDLISVGVDSIEH